MARKNKPTDVFKHIDMSGGHNACWPWKRQLHKGRPYFDVNGKKRLAYRITYELFHGVELTTEDMLLHQCDNSACCNPRHLNIGEHQQNMDEMVQRERHGMPHHAVRGIRKLLMNGHTHQSIADLYGCSRETVTAIHNQRRREKVSNENVSQSDDPEDEE